MGYGVRNLLGGVLATAVLSTPLVASAQLEGNFRPQTAVSTAVAIVRPSVVAIETRFKEPILDDDYAYWQYLRGARPLYGLWGSGFIYKDPQYVVTTAFLMDHAEYIRVILDDGRAYQATLVGKNDDLEVAVLKVDWGPDMEPIVPPLGDSDKLDLGQPIAIVGKALNSVDTYTSFGVVSAIRKEVPGSDVPTDEFLQFDASYELSFIGAPMVDVHGNVVAMVDRTVQDFSLTNINLAAPINEVIAAADRIISGDNVETWFGVEQTRVTHPIIANRSAPAQFDWNQDGKPEPLEFGMFTTYIEPLSPADIAGLKAGDIIVELDSKRLKYDYDWDSTVREFRVGQLVTVRFIRNTGTPDAPRWQRMETQVQILQQEESAEDEDGSGGGGSPHGSSYHSAKAKAEAGKAGRNRNAVFPRRGGRS
jgi:S1-C subfamily serine protease